MIARFLSKNPRILLLTIVVICACGISSFFVMPRLEDPVLRRRVALLSTVYPGANAQRVESVVTIPLEEKLSGIAKIKQIRSNSQNGMSNLVIELEDEVDDVESVWTTVRNRIAEAKLSLPESTVQSDLHVVPLKAFAAIIAIRSTEAGETDLSRFRKIARSLRRSILTIPGTENVDTFGDPGEEFLVELNPTDFVATGLSVTSIAEQIHENILNRPAGQLRQNDLDLGLEILNDSSPKQLIADAPISSGAGRQSVPVSEIATVSKSVLDPPSAITMIDGQRAIVLGAMVSDEIRVDHWADQLEAALKEFQNEKFDDVNVAILFSQREHIDFRMQTLWGNLGKGTAAVMLVVLVLMGWRSMLVVGAALPLSALMVLFAMRVMSIPIHQMSVTGLIIAIGLLIDNAIVIVDEVRSRIVAGSTPSNAIVAGVSHLAMPLFGSTLTTALAFLPIATLPGPPGEFVGTIATSVILAISASFILAMTVIPALIGLLGVRPGKHGFLAIGLTIGPIQSLYEFSLRIIFRVPIIGVLLGLVLPALGFLAIQKLPEQFFPASDRSQVQIEVELAASDNLQATEVTVEAIQEIVAAQPEVDRQYWMLGESAPTFYYNVVPRRRGTPQYAQGFLDLAGEIETEEFVTTLQNVIDEKIPEARVLVRQLEQGPPFDAPVEVRLIGPELSILRQLGSELRLLLSQTTYVLHTRSDLEETIPRLTLEMDESVAKQTGLNRSQLAGMLYTSLEGTSAGTVFEDDEEVAVRVKLELDGPLKQERLFSLPIPQSGQPAGPTPNQASSHPQLSAITFSSLTKSKLDADAGAIVRIDGQRANEVKAYIQAGALPSAVLAEFRQRLADSDFTLPTGYTIQFGGETEKRTEAVRKLIANGFILFALMLLTLVASFRSFRCAAIIAMVGGLSVGLGPLALSTFGFPFGFVAIVGTMGLVGVAINDSIVVLAAIRSGHIADHQDRSELVTIVSSCTRHIITTTLTTIVGFTPLILGGGGFWPPLAITIAGGVGGATFLALYFVPSMFLLLFRPKSTPLERT